MKLAYLQLAMSMGLVGINIAVGKIIIQTIPIFLFSELRFVIASLVLVPLMVSKGENHFRLTGKEWGLLFLQAFFGVFLFSIFMLYGVRSTSAVAAGIITSTTPACIALIALLFLREKLRLSNILAIGLAVLGIALVSVNWESGDGTNVGGADALFGNGLVSCAVVSEALFTIFAKPLSAKLNPLPMAAMVNLFGLLLFLPFSVHQLLTGDLTIGLTVWLMILYYSLTASVLSFLLWYRGMQTVPASIAGLFTVFMPVSAALCGIVFLQENLTARHIAGIALAMVAIYIGVRQTGPGTPAESGAEKNGSDRGLGKK